MKVTHCIFLLTLSMSLALPTLAMAQSNRQILDVKNAQKSKTHKVHIRALLDNFFGSKAVDQIDIRVYCDEHDISYDSHLYSSQKENGDVLKRSIILSLPFDGFTFDNNRYLECQQFRIIPYAAQYKNIIKPYQDQYVWLYSMGNTYFKPATRKVNVSGSLESQGVVVDSSAPNEIYIRFVGTSLTSAKDHRAKDTSASWIKKLFQSDPHVKIPKSDYFNQFEDGEPDFEDVALKEDSGRPDSIVQPGVEIRGNTLEQNLKVPKRSYGAAEDGEPDFEDVALKEDSGRPDSIIRPGVEIRGRALEQEIKAPKRSYGAAEDGEPDFEDVALKEDSGRPDSIIQPDVDIRGKTFESH